MKKEKKKVLLVMHMPPPVHGAALIGQFIKSSKIINEKFECHYVNMTTAKSLDDIGKGGFDKYKAFFRLLRDVYKEIRLFKPDVVCVTPNSAGSPFYKDFFIVEFIKMIKAKSTKVALHFHNKGVKTREKRIIDNFLYKLFFKNVKVILLGRSLYGDISKYLNSENVAYCPNGIPALITDIDVEEKKHNDVPKLLWLTNIMITKGIMEYIQALRILRDRGCEFIAEFVGNSTIQLSAEGFMSELTLNDLSDCTRYLGFRSGKEKTECYKSSDIFVLPSYTEAFPLTILEAMSCGVPVIATNVGGVSEAIVDGKTGFIIGGKEPILLNNFKPSAIELADKLEILIKDKSLRMKMSKESRKKFNEKFTLEVFEHNFSDVLMNL